MPDISALSLVLTSDQRTVLYRRRAPESTLDERVRAQIRGYRTFVADGQIYTDILVEGTAGTQEFVSLQKVTFMAKPSELPEYPKTRPMPNGF